MFTRFHRAGTSKSARVALARARSLIGSIWKRLRAPRRLVAAVLAVMGAVGTVAGFRELVRQQFARPAPLSGDINVAVTRFGSQLPRERSSISGESTATALAATLRADLRSLLSGRGRDGSVPLDVQVRGPHELGAVEGTTEQQRLHSLANIAGANNADVVASASLRQDAIGLQVAPTVYIAPSRLRGAEELSGAVDFGTPIRIFAGPGRTTLAAAHVRAAVARRVEVLAAFTLGLAYFSDALAGERRSLRAADDLFHRARGLATGQGSVLTAFLDLYLGNVAGQLGDYATAERDFRAAVAAEPAFGRARYALAEIYFLKHAGDCDEATIRPASVGTAITELSAVAGDAAEPVQIRSRAHATIARALICLTDAGTANRLPQARTEAQLAIGLLEQRSTRPDEDLSKAHEVLGETWLRGTTTSDLINAAAEFRTAVTLTKEARRIAGLNMNLHYVHLVRGDTASARACLRAAISADPAHAGEYRREAAAQQRSVQSQRAS